MEFLVYFLPCTALKSPLLSLFNFFMSSMLLLSVARFYHGNSRISSGFKASLETIFSCFDKDSVLCQVKCFESSTRSLLGYKEWTIYVKGWGQGYHDQRREQWLNYPNSEKQCTFYVNISDLIIWKTFIYFLHMPYQWCLDYRWETQLRAPPTSKSLESLIIIETLHFPT